MDAWRMLFPPGRVDEPSCRSMLCQSAPGVTKQRAARERAIPGVTVIIPRGGATRIVIRQLGRLRQSVREQERRSAGVRRSDTMTRRTTPTINERPVMDPTAADRRKTGKGGAPLCGNAPASDAGGPSSLGRRGRPRSEPSLRRPRGNANRSMVQWSIDGWSGWGASGWNDG